MKCLNSKRHCTTLSSPSHHPSAGLHLPLTHCPTGSCPDLDAYNFSSGKKSICQTFKWHFWLAVSFFVLCAVVLLLYSGRCCRQALCHIHYRDKNMLYTYAVYTVADAWGTETNVNQGYCCLTSARYIFFVMSVYVESSRSSSRDTCFQVWFFSSFLLLCLLFRPSIWSSTYQATFWKSETNLLWPYREMRSSFPARTFLSHLRRGFPILHSKCLSSYYAEARDREGVKSFSERLQDDDGSLGSVGAISLLHLAGILCLRAPKNAMNSRPKMRIYLLLARL